MSWFDTALAAWYRSKEQERAINAQGIEQAGQALTQGLQQARQDNIANQVSRSLVNSGAYADQNSGANAPRAGLVSAGTNPITGAVNRVAAGVPTAGTAPVGGGGGMLGFQLRNALANQGVERDLKRAQIGYYGAHGAAALQGAASNESWRKSEQDRADAQAAAIRAATAGGGPAAARTQAQAQRDALMQAQKDAEAKAQTPETLMRDFDVNHGKGAAQSFYDAYTNNTGARGDFSGGKWIGNPNGPLFTADPEAQAYGQPPNAADIKAVPITELDAYRTNLQKVQAAGGRIVPPIVMPAQAPGQSAPAQGGSVPTFQTTQQALQSGLPRGSPFQDPTGTIRYMP